MARIEDGVSIIKARHGATIEVKVALAVEEAVDSDEEVAVQREVEGIEKARTAATGAWTMWDQEEVDTQTTMALKRIRMGTGDRVTEAFGTIIELVVWSLWFDTLVA